MADQNIVQVDLYPGVRRRMSADIDLPVGTVIDDIDRHAARRKRSRRHGWNRIAGGGHELARGCRRRLEQRCGTGTIPGNGKRQRAGAFGSRLSGDILRRFRDNQHDHVTGLQGFVRVRQLCRQAELPTAGGKRFFGKQDPFAALVGGRLPDRSAAIEDGDRGMGFRLSGDHGIALRVDADNVESGSGTGGKLGSRRCSRSRLRCLRHGESLRLGLLFPGL